MFTPQVVRDILHDHQHVVMGWPLGMQAEMAHLLGVGVLREKKLWQEIYQAYRQQFEMIYDLPDTFAKSYLESRQDMWPKLLSLKPGEKISIRRMRGFDYLAERTLSLTAPEASHRL